MTPYSIVCLRNQVHIIGPTIRRLRQVVAHHYKHRHDGRGSKAVRNWIRALRDADRASGYSAAVAALAEFDRTVEDTEDDDTGLTRADLQQFYGPSVRI